MRLLPRNSVRLLWLVANIMALGGCHISHPQPQKCCPAFTSQRSDFQPSYSSRTNGIEADFDAFPSYATLRQANESRSNRRTAPIKIEEAMCAAARNSELADLIEAERHALNCRTTDREMRAVDWWLQGQALEQRNQAAAMAGKLFLNLVEVDLQTVLLHDSKQHLDELEETIRVAAEEGLATADGQQRLDKDRLRWQALESKLDSSRQLLSCQLNAIINANAKTAFDLRPVYQLKPIELNLEPNTESELAEANRPGVLALAADQSSGGNPALLLRLIGQSDSPLGIASAGKPMGQKLALRGLQRRLANLQSPQEESNSAQLRRDQLSRMLAAKQKAVRTEAKLAVIKIQTAAERIALANATLETLEAQVKQLEAKRELDAKGVYLELNRNWAEQQVARSDRITAAIEHDTAVLELLGAQGQLVRNCGYDFDSACTSQ